MGDISKNFNLKEFTCKCGCKFDKINPLIVEMCQAIRDEICSPLIINSGCRCEKHNDAVGSTSKNHVHGNAADLSCASKTPDELWFICQYLYNHDNKLKGLELCLHEGGWLHIDCDRKRSKIFQHI